jgi:glucokinase
MTDARVAVTGAVDIGGTKIAIGAVDARGRVLAKRLIPTAPRDGFDAVMERILGMLTEIREETGANFRGIGIGCTGPVDPVTGVIGDVEFLPGWQGCNPVERLGQAFGVDAVMENDADAAVLAEAEWGTGRGKHSIICVTVGTGIGAGVVLDGSLYRGPSGVHPELGHHVIDCNGPRCFCGANGCWEVLARGPAMVERMRQIVPVEHPSRKPFTGKLICAMARSGDETAKAEVEREGLYLGIGVANLITLFAPEVIALGGSVMNDADLFMPIIRETVARNCGLVDWRQTTITTASLGNDTALIGAGSVWRHRYQQQQAGVPC